MTTETAVWDYHRLQHLLATSDKALAKALWTIFQRQTTDERATLTTRVRNNRGFNSRDAEFLSSVASKLPRYDMNMTVRQIAKVRPMMRKYWAQLLEEIEAKGGKVDKRRPASAKAREAEDDEMATSPFSEIAQSPNRENTNPLYGVWG